MKNEMVIGMSLGNASMEADKEFESFIREAPNQFEVYQFEPPIEETKIKEGESPEEYSLRKKRYWAAIDWVLISRIADVITVASFLWLLYDHLKQSRKHFYELYISIDADHSVIFRLPTEFTDREMFIEEFSTKVSKYLSTDEAGHHFEETVSDVNISGMWIRKN